MPKHKARRIQVRIPREDAVYPILITKECQRSSLRKIFSSLGLLECRGPIGRVRRRACILIDEGFARARADVVGTIVSLYEGENSISILVSKGEGSKSFETANKILGQMIEAGLTRNDVCIAIGGGVVGDLGGFVASLYHRGLDIVHIPTTLLSMVDSSIGGKTAVNHSLGKNLIGTFHQPCAVLIVLDILRTLPDSDYASGLGEVFKYAVGFSPKFFNFLKKNSEQIRARHPKALETIILESARIKAKVVEVDERETGVARLKLNYSKSIGDRRLLNLGHTAGHGLEKAYAVPHGIAVAIGITMAAKLSVHFKLCPERCYDEIRGLAIRMGLQTEDSFNWKLSEIMPYMQKDKKMAGGRLQYVCLKGIGRATIRPTRLSELSLLEKALGKR